MKCRLYLNKEQKKIIDDAIYALKVAYNVTLHEMFEDYECTKEKPYKPKEGEENRELKVIHYPDCKKAASAEHLNKLREKYPIINCTKAACLSTNNGIFASDMKTAFASVYRNKTENKNADKINSDSKKSKQDKSLAIEFIDRKKDIRFYSKSKPRSSLTFQIAPTSFYIKTSEETKRLTSNITEPYNRNVLYVDLGKFGENKCGIVKIRGWNKNVRFDQTGKIDFISWLNSNPKNKITMTITKDKCGDYYVCLKFGRTYNKKNKEYQGIQIFKPFNEAKGEVGIDVGKTTLITCSDEKIEDDYYKGGRVENPRFKAQNRDKIRALNKRLSRRKGYSNKAWLEEYKKDRDNITPSKRYIKTQERLAKLHRKIARKREYYYHVATKRLIENYMLIGIESLTVSDMYKDSRTEDEKDINSPEFKSKKTVHRKNENTADAAMYSLLQMIKYKGEWYKRNIIAVGKYYPSSKTCHNCGYINSNLKEKDRIWICPICGEVIDRDKNAALNILAEAKRIFLQQTDK